MLKIIIYIILAFIFLFFVGVFAMFLLVKSFDSWNSSINNEAGANKRKQKDKNACEYCGSKILKNDEECPYCGAKQAIKKNKKHRS